ncbi:MAG: accessory gene regulator B family protein [Eubacterium sp.]|nr:accessory gene regulator B family protein [Eubacterium sp.]
MNTFALRIQKMYGYTDYEMAVIKYSITALFSELSKIFILSILYLYIEKFNFFIVSCVLLIFLRKNGGGYHCKHYITCLLLTAFISTAAIVLLPLINIPNFSIILLTLIICLFTNYFIGPVSSPFRAEPNALLIKRCKNNVFLTIFIFIIIVSIFNSNIVIRPYLIVGFWTIILHTLQLIVAKILRKGEFY